MHPLASAVRELVAPSNTDAMPHSSRAATGLLSMLLLAMQLAGCESIRPYVRPSEGHISAAQVKPEVDRTIPPPARISPFVPPPKPAVPTPTYSVVVNEVPVKELLLALARDTKQNIDIHPTLTGLVSLNAINETLPAILERISKQVNLRYRVEGNTIVVSPDTPYIKTYVVGYVNIQRTTTSNTGASGQIAVSSGGAGGGAGEVEVEVERRQATLPQRKSKRSRARTSGQSLRNQFAPSSTRRSSRPSRRRPSSTASSS